MSAVFISYQRNDRPFAAHALAYALRAEKHEVFIDTGSIGPGQVFLEPIREALARTNVVLCLIGPDFNVDRLGEPANPVSFEWRRALFHGCTIVPVLIHDPTGRSTQTTPDAVMPAARDLPAELRWFALRDAEHLARDTLSRDIDALVHKMPSLSAAPHRAIRVLWVDDQPANNEDERRELRGHGFIFDNVVSTEEALFQLEHATYDLVISDLGREHSSDESPVAGKELLRHPLFAQAGPPVLIYANYRAVRQRDSLIELGAVWSTDDPDELYLNIFRLFGMEGE
jgi:CheY-like chemotaxis protein